MIVKEKNSLYPLYQMWSTVFFKSVAQIIHYQQILNSFNTDYY